MFWDTLAHPTLDGKWIGGRKGQTFDELYKNAKLNDIRRVMCVGLPGVGSYSHDQYFRAANSFGEYFIPVATCTETMTNKIRKELIAISELGYSAVKIHPRLLKKSIDRHWLGEVLVICSQLDLTVLLCTYYHCKCSEMIITDPYWEIIAAIQGAPRARIILIHGGGSELLKYSELARFNDNILIDLSLTIMKYEGSSIDDDIVFLFNKFDQKICIGSDHPEWSYSQINSRLSTFLAGVDSDKAENILQNNIENFMK